MRNPLAPNGVTSSKIICRLARKEFGDDVIKVSESYVSIKRDIIKTLKKMEPGELEENRLDTLVRIEHLKQNDFGNFVSVRFAYWALIISMATMIIGDIPIYSYFNMTKRNFGIIVIILLTVLLITMARVIHIQHDNLEYLNFKLLCFEEMSKSGKK